MEARDGGSAPLPCSYAPLPEDAEAATTVGRARRTAGPLCAALMLVTAAVLLMVAALAGVRLAGQLPADGIVGVSGDQTTVDAAMMSTSSRGPESGVSEKTSGAAAHGGMLGADASGNAFPWSNAMLQWQRTGFHFQPEKNWMNDPNGPVYYKGWYHLFYQYNPDGAIWGNKIAWGHAASRDLLRWRHLPVAMSPDQWYDINGVWSGSATVLPDGRIVMLYTGSTNASVQVQCLAFPTDPSDPLLINWTKYENNPVMYPPPGVGEKDFRDPTTAWFDGSDDTWRLVIGSKDDHHAGMVMTYKTKDFIDYELVPGLLHRVPGTGMWECIDLYPVGGLRGIDMTEAVAAASNNGGGDVLHVMKESSDDDRHDYYALGRYDAAKNTWTPLDSDADVGIGLRYDWGKFYASKTFYDPSKKRRVLWGWVGETDSEHADVAKGWASLQSIPRTVVLDTKTGSNLLQWPVEEVETLRTNSTNLGGVTVEHGSVFPLSLHRATQLDIEASFRLDPLDVAAAKEADVGYNCSTSGGTTGRGTLGPFGLLVLADARHHSGDMERTGVYFYVARGLDGGLRTHFCHDETRSSHANDIVKKVVGNIVPVLDGEEFSVRVLVDHSIVESFAMGGRLTATSRVYPTEAIYANAGVYLFNNATSARVNVTRLVVHEMDSSYNQAYMTSL
uniref:Acid beta-fructofuranosidase n=1 Tax=Triticum aestivum TaxID=4565 RepID=Q575T1_WHEAT|nr:acid beta-fructofuranosidase precursor [Triticum aestivum]